MSLLLSEALAERRARLAESAATAPAIATAPDAVAAPASPRTASAPRSRTDRWIDDASLDGEAEATQQEIVSTRAQRKARPRVVYALIVVGGIGAILLAQLMLSILLADGAYRISALQVEQRDYSREQQALDERLRIVRSTQSLVTKAEGLGMVQSGNPVFLDAASGAVTGTGSEPGGSLVGTSGNLVGNSLLTGDGVAGDAAADAAAQGATADASGVPQEDGGIATGANGTGSTGSAGSGSTGGAASGSPASGGTATGGTTGGGRATVTNPGAPPAAPGTIAAPTTH